MRRHPPADLPAARCERDGTRGPHHARPGGEHRARGAARQLLHGGSGGHARGLREAALGAPRRRCGGEWPDRLEVAIEEHVALARWRDTALVNDHGEVFEAATDARLPVFAGPEGSAAEMAAQYGVFAKLLASIGRAPAQLRLSERRAWELQLDNGDVLELGREDMAARLGRFATLYERTVGRLAAEGLPDRPALSQRFRAAATGAALGPAARLTATAMNRPKDSKNLIVGLDIGTSKIVAMVAEIKPEGGFEVIGNGSHPSRGLKKGMVVNIESTVGAIQRALEEAELMADCKIQRGLHRHRRQPHPELQFARHGGDQGPGGGAARRRPRDRDRQGGQHPDRPADPAHPQPGIHHRRPGGRARAARHERDAPGGQGAHRHRCGVGGAEHHEVRAPLRPGGQRPDPAAAGLGQGGAVGRREGPGRVPGRHRRRHHRHRGVHRRRDPAYRGDPDRRRPDHQRHRDGAAHADQGCRGDQAKLRLRAAPAGRPRRRWSRCPAWASAARASCRARPWPR